MKIGVEIDMVVADSLKVLKLNEKIFDIKRVKVSNFPTGSNEVVFSLYGVHFHMLDENPKFGMKAPSTEHTNTIWFNIMVPDIKEIFERAIEAGCTKVQKITEIPDFGVSNAMFRDSFGYLWMLHQVHKEVSYEERIKLLKKKNY